MFFGEPEGNLVHAAVERFFHVRSQDGNEPAFAHDALEGGPLGELPGEAGFIPDLPAFQAQKERHHPAVAACAHAAAGNGHGTVDLPIDQQLAEENRHGEPNRFHGDSALHGQDGRDAGLGKPRRKRRLRGHGLVLRERCLLLAAALTGSQHRQPGRLHQLADAGGEVLAAGGGGAAGVVLQVEQRLPLAERAVADEVQDVDAGAQLIDQPCQGERLVKSCDENVDAPQLRAGALHFARGIDRREPGRQVRRRRYRDQRAQACPGAKPDVAPVVAGEKARKEDSFRHRPGSVGDRVEQQFPTHKVQARCVCPDQQPHAQHHGAVLDRRRNLRVLIQQLRRGEKPVREYPAIGGRVILALKQVFKLDPAVTLPGLTLGIVERIGKAQLHFEGDVAIDCFRLRSLHSDFELSVRAAGPFHTCSASWITQCSTGMSSTRRRTAGSPRMM